MVFYEIVLTVDAAAPGPRLVDFLKRTARHVVARSGNVRKIENWGERQLAFRVRKDQRNHHSARFLSLFIDAHPTVLKEVESLSRFNRDVLRQVTFKRKFSLPQGDGFLATEIREAAMAAEVGARLPQ
jgi:small subunit ribosomal protein S6